MVVHSSVYRLGSQVGSYSLGFLMKLQLDTVWACTFNIAPSHGSPLMLAAVWELSWACQMAYIHVVQVIWAFHSIGVMLSRRSKLAALIFLALDEDSYQAGLLCASALSSMVVKMLLQVSQIPRQLF